MSGEVCLQILACLQKIRYLCTARRPLLTSLFSVPLYYRALPNMADRTHTDAPSPPEADEHKLGGSTATDSFEDPSRSNFDHASSTGSALACYIDGTDFAVWKTPAEDNTKSARHWIHRNLDSVPPRSESRSSTAYAESIYAESVFSHSHRTESISSNGSHSADSTKSSPRMNGPIAVYPTPVESLFTLTQPTY